MDIKISAKDRIVCVNISRTFDNNERESDYDRARHYWRIDKSKADKANLVFAVVHGRVQAVFKPTQPWYLCEDYVGKSKRYGFEGEQIFDSPYIGMSLDGIINTHCQNPVGYINI
jgi:hypothetical protein